MDKKTVQSIINAGIEYKRLARVLELIHEDGTIIVLSEDRSARIGDGDVKLKLGWLIESRLEEIENFIRHDLLKTTENDN